MRVPLNAEYGGVGVWKDGQRGVRRRRRRRRRRRGRRKRRVLPALCDSQCA
jgi:hypothetical protein